MGFDINKFKRGASRLTEDVKGGIKKFNESQEQKQIKALENDREELKRLRAQREVLQERAKIQRIKDQLRPRGSPMMGTFGNFGQPPPAPRSSKKKRQAPREPWGGSFF